MTGKNLNILVIEPSYIIYEGLLNILNRTGHRYNISRIDELADIHEDELQKNAKIVLINPSLVQNQIKLFISLKKEMPDTQWIALIYSFFDQQLLSNFDDILSINDPPERIVNLLTKMIHSGKPVLQTPQNESLSERETEVLRLLVNGNSNKEIADKLFISTHTVITHRKNISQKTGIKSVSGLTIYAVVHNIVSLERQDG